jgi:predicted aspartyl protease
MLQKGDEAMSKPTFLFLVLVTLVSSGASQSNAAQTPEDKIAIARRRVVEPPKTIELDSSVVKVPMVGTKTLPLVEVKLNGKGPYRLLVDTGANVTMLQIRVADELKLPVLRPGDKSKLVALESVDIGGAHFRDLVVGARTWDEKIDGVLGFNLFADCLLTLDYLRQQISLQKGVLPKANGKDVLSYSLNDNRHPVIEINIGKVRNAVMIDTGAAQGVVVPHALASKLRFISGLVPGPNLSTFSTPQSRAMVGRLEGSIRFGIHEIVEPTIYVRDEEIPIIGSGVLMGFVLTFDQKNKTVRITV